MRDDRANLNNMADTINVVCESCGKDMDWIFGLKVHEDCLIQCDHLHSSKCRKDGCPCQEDHYCQNSK